MKIKNDLNIILLRLKEDIIHARKYIKNIDEKDTEIDYEFSHIPSDKEYRIFITVKAKEKPILNDAEKAYLSAVTKPFKNRIVNIKKLSVMGDTSEYISLQVKSIKAVYDEFMPFPRFVAGTMYKGMKIGRKYTLKELGLE